MTLGDLEPVKRWILGFGDAARVIEPTALANEIADAFRTAAERYAFVLMMVGLSVVWGGAGLLVVMAIWG